MEQFKSERTAEGKELTKIVDWVSSYNLSIMLGDLSLIDDWLPQLRRRFAKLTTPLQIGIDALLYGPGLVLFQLVILRTYLGQKP